MRKPALAAGPLAASIAALAMIVPAAASAQYAPPPPPPGGYPMQPMPNPGGWWNQHPGYLHAMSDLRSAYWLVQHRDPSDPMQGREEGAAMNQISAAYQALRAASIRDGKNVMDQPPAGFAFGDHRGRLHRAMDLLHSAHNSIAREEDNPAARGLRNQAIGHIDGAARALAAAMQAWHWG